MRFETILAIECFAAAGFMSLVLLASKAVKSQPLHWSRDKGRTTEVLDNVGIEVLETPAAGKRYWREWVG